MQAGKADCSSRLSAFRDSNVPTQAEVMAHWQTDPDQPLVSVFCAAFNHQDYIEDALRGFVLQQTPFAFEVMVHDDASTDGTADIIRAWAARYPAIIKPVLQTQNQHSQGKKPSAGMRPLSTGPLIALCEGDDYWTDPLKLARQAAILQNDPGIGMVVHNAVVSNGEQLKPFSKAAQAWTFSEIDILNTDRQFAPTASYLFRRELYETLPAWFGSAPVGDLYIELYCQKLGRGYYLPEMMSVYRRDVTGSWSEGIEQSRQQKMRFLCANMDCLKKLIDDFPQARRAIQAKIRRSQHRLLSNLMEQGDNAALRAAIESLHMPRQRLHLLLLDKLGLPALRLVLALERRIAKQR